MLHIVYSFKRVFKMGSYLKVNQCTCKVVIIRLCVFVYMWKGAKMRGWFLPWEFALFIDQRSFNKQSTRTDVASYKSFRDPDLVFIVTLIAFFTLFYPIYSTNILLRRGSHGKFLSRGPSNKNKEIPCLLYLSFVQVVSWRHTRTNCCMNHCHHHQFYSFIFVFSTTTHQSVF